jgi:ankyrin repeat protein
MSWCVALALLAVPPVVGSAADQCQVSDLVIGISDGPAKYLGGGPVAFTGPQVKVMTTTILKPPGATRSAASSGNATTAGGAAPMSALKPAPRPPRPVPKNDQERMFAAVYEGDLAEVQRLLRSPAVDVNAPSRSDLRGSLIDLAAGGAQSQIVQALIERGERVRGPVEAVDVRPIAVAMLNLKITIQFHGVPGAFTWRPERSPQDFEATIRVLLDAGADADGMLDPTHPDSALGVLLSTPRFAGDMRIARLLLDHGARLDASAPGGSPLAAAIAIGRDDFLDLALEVRHLDPSALDAGLAPALARHDARLVSELLNAGASPDAHDPYGHSLLCATLMGGEQSRSLAMLFLQHGAHATVDCMGAPPINLAMKDRELALLLLNHGADPSRTDREGATALNLVADTDHELIDTLLKHGAQLGQPISDQRIVGIGTGTGPSAGPTLRAILHRQDYLATGLLRRDGLQGDTPCTALLYAAAVGTNGTLAELLHRGADPNSMTQRGVTALMTAAYHSDTDALRILLAHPSIRVDQLTPTVFNPGALVGYNEDSPPPRTGHRTALMYAAAAGHAEICHLLIQHGASTRETDAEGKTALDYARSPEARIELQAARSTR